MYETKNQPLASTQTFIFRILWSILFGFLIIIIGLLIGMTGLHVTEKMPWFEGFLNSALILSDMGPITKPTTPAGQLFIALYSLFSGLAFIFIVSVVFAPVIHRFLHKFHVNVL